MQLVVQSCADGSTLSLSGDLDTEGAEQLEQCFEELVAEVQGSLVIDVTHVGFLNSKGIRSFLRLDKLLKAKGASIVFKGASLGLFRNFRYCGLDSYFTFADPDLVSLRRLHPVP